MRVVIDIPDEEYTVLAKWFKLQKLSATLEQRIFCAVADGTVLPEGHGDLIDRDAIARKILPLIDPETRLYIEEKLYNAPTVIKADKIVEDTSITKECITCKHYAPDDYDISDRCCECLEDNIIDKTKRNDRSLWSYPKWEAKEENKE